MSLDWLFLDLLIHKHEAEDNPAVGVFTFPLQLHLATLWKI